MSNHWWRAYDDAIDHAKLLLLSDAQHRGWFNLLCLASANGGALPDMKVLALKLRMKPAKVQALLDSLTDAKLIDSTETGLWPHDWNGRQYKSDVSTERVKRFRNKDRNVSVAVSETDQRQSTDTEKKDGASAPPPIDPDADLFRRGKEVLGADAGSLIARLKKSKGGISQARAVIEQASTKENPREYVGRVMNGPARATTPSGSLWPEGIT